MNKKSDNPKRLHPENHKGMMISDVILGGQDGLVNTLGVILGIAAASSDLRIVVAGGLAGAIAEAISMGAVGYTSSIAERDFYLSQVEKEKYEMRELPELEREEIRQIYMKKGFTGKLLDDVVEVITSNEHVWLETMMQQELNLQPVEDKRPLTSAVWVGFSALFGSIIPLLPFLVALGLNFQHSSHVVSTSIYIALGLSALTLFIVGAVKSKLTVGVWYKSGIQMMVIGTISALAGYLIGLLFGASV